MFSQWLDKGVLAPDPDKKEGEVEYRFQLNGAAVNTQEFAQAVYHAYGKEDLDVFDPDTDHNINPGDSVPLFIGGNAKDIEESLDAMLNIFALFGENSPHSDYHCSGDFCAQK